MGDGRRQLGAFSLFDGFFLPLLCSLREACDGPRDLAFLHATAARVLAEQKFLRPSENITCVHSTCHSLLPLAAAPRT